MRRQNFEAARLEQASAVFVGIRSLAVMVGARHRRSRLHFPL
jgi:hypothetical protein